MPRALKLCLAASVALVACNRPLPLESPRTPSATDTRQSTPGASSTTHEASPDAAPSSADTRVASSGDASAAAPGSDAAGVDAAIDLFPSDGRSLPYRAIGVATGEVHTCALLEDHRVKCWGNNSFGQLGYGDTRDRGGSPADMGDALPIVDLGIGRTAVAIAAGHYATCAILDDGSIKCWGQVGAGLGGFPPAGDIGDAPGQMGDHLAPLDLGGRRAVHLAMGAIAAGCASMDDDTIWCWDVGAKPWPQFWLPAKPVSALAPAGGGLVALYDDGSVSPALPNGGTVPLITSDHGVRAVAGSEGGGTCFLLDDGTTTCEVAPSDWLEGPVNAIAIGVELPGGLCSGFADGSVRCQNQTCVQPTHYQCSGDGSFALGAPVVAMTSNGTNFGCALLADGDIKCWDGSSTGPSSVWLGCEFAVTTQTDGGITYGAWHSVDLGTHP
jgi:hypothetical protein